MPTLTTIFVSSLALTAAGVTVDRSDGVNSTPYYQNAPAATASFNQPIASGSVPKVTEIRLHGETTNVSASATAPHAIEVAPNPPSVGGLDSPPGVFQPEMSSAPLRTGSGSTSPLLERTLTPDSTQMPPQPARPQASSGETDSSPPKAASPISYLKSSESFPAALSTPLAGSPTATPSLGLPSGTATTQTTLSPTGSVEKSGTPLLLGSRSDKASNGKAPSTNAMLTVGGSLSICLGLFFAVAWAMRKTAPRGSVVLPNEVFDILGRSALGARQQVQLLRCGNKLLLVSIAPAGVETLTEITDPLEVDRLAGLCQQAHPKSATTAFRQVFQQLAPKSGRIDDLDQLEPAGGRRRRYRWEDK